MDKSRMDWLEEHKALLNYSDNGPHVCIVDDRPGELFHTYGNTYREAVDTAIRTYEPYWRPAPKADFNEIEKRYLDAKTAYETALLQRVVDSSHSAALNGKSK